MGVVWQERGRIGVWYRGGARGQRACQWRIGRGERHRYETIRRQCQMM